MPTFPARSRRSRSVWPARNSAASSGEKFSLHAVSRPRRARAKDGAIVIGSLTQANFSAARAVLGIDDDPMILPDFDAGSSEHQALRGVLRDRIRDIFLTRTVDEWVRDFQAAGVPVAPVNLPEELADDPHVSSMMVTVEHELGVSSSRSGRSPPSLHHPPK
jgi:crotonobetainyl-CoA:carnitine CoA-transferase CaiB-like acyl-CoA transferase